MIPALTAVEKLAKLFADESRLQEKVRDIKAALSHTKRQISESLVQRYVTVTEEKVQMPEDLMKQEQSYERLLLALQEMKAEIVKQIRPVEEQIIHASQNQLRDSFKHESSRLSKCLEEIDHKILDCRKYLEEYDQIRATLHDVNEKLSRLGVEALPVADNLPTHDVGEIIRGRIEHLRSQGKL